jgi:hypothetical protein
LIALWFFLSPYLTVYRLRDAAERGDAERLSTMIDYPALRESLKGSLRASMAERMSQENDDALANLGLLWVGAMIDPMIDSMISPEGMAALVQGAIPKPGQSQATAGMPVGAEPAAPPGEGQEAVTLTTSMGYEGLNRFAVTFTDRAAGEEQVKFFLHRRGLSWKLAAMTLPRL